MLFRVVLNRFYFLSFARNQNLIAIKPLICKTTDFRMFSAKHKDIDIDKKLEKDPNLSVNIMIVDENGKVLGVKTKTDANLLAKKMSMFLIEEHNKEMHKYPVFKLVSNKQLAKLGENNSESDETTADPHFNQEKSSVKNQSRETKRMAFSAKVENNDLMTKIKQIKKWVSKDCEINISVNSRQNDIKQLENIFQRFEQELKGIAKFRQKKITNNNMKFIIFSLVDSKDQVIAQDSEVKTDEQSIDFDNLDPNKLLSDEFEESLKK